MTLVFRNFPLSHLHPHALMAAEAAEAARSQGKFEEMYQALFENQPKLSPSLIAQIAAEINLNLERFSHDWQSHTQIAKIRKDIEDGIARGVHRTPTFFINETRFDEQWSLAGLESALQRELPV